MGFAKLNPYRRTGQQTCVASADGIVAARDARLRASIIASDGGSPQAEMRGLSEMRNLLVMRAWNLPKLGLAALVPILA
jgi:hypothetical protein